MNPNASQRKYLMFKIDTGFGVGQQLETTQSRQDSFDNMGGFFDSGQSLIKSLILERQFLVIDSQLVQDRCVQVANVRRILNDVVAVIVGRSVFASGLNSRAGHPKSKTTAVMIAAMVVFGKLTL